MIENALPVEMNCYYLDIGKTHKNQGSMVNTLNIMLITDLNPSH